MRLSVLLSLVVCLALVALGFFYFRDTSAPDLDYRPVKGPVSGQSPPVLLLADGGSGLKFVEVTLVQKERSDQLPRREFPPGTASTEVVVDLAQLRMEQGPFRLRVRAGDHSVYRFGAGNLLEEELELEFDGRPPVPAVLSRAHNFTQGGSGAILFSAGEPLQEAGVQVADRFFPAHPLPTGEHFALFAQDYALPPGEFEPRLVAVDLAGNRAEAGFYHFSNPRAYPESTITVSDGFLRAKMPQFQSLFPDLTDDFLKLFLAVNGELREENRRRLQELARETAGSFLWEGPFLRQPNSATMGHFGDRRRYLYDGEVVDRQTHLGIDLASVARAPVLAANRGRVIFADFLGIYGNCVILDHGLGLQTLYGHLSQIDVKPGDMVDRGQAIARSGATGMAGGDHLHYAVLVAGFPVNPLEWWDPNWIRNNITSKLDSAGE